MWLKAAECDAYTGNIEGMSNCLAKVIVFGGDADKDKAVKFIADIVKAKALPKAPPPKPTAEGIKEIADSYSWLNMQPRSIRVLRYHQKLVGKEARLLEEDYTAEWLLVLKKFSSGRMDNKTVVYGQDVSRKEDRLRVVIPYPCSKEALAAVVKALKEKPLE